MTLGTWAVQSVSRLINYLMNLFIELLDACGLGGFYVVMAGVAFSIAAVLIPMVLNAPSDSGSDSASSSGGRGRRRR